MKTLILDALSKSDSIGGLGTCLVFIFFVWVISIILKNKDNDV